jgi:hypothetical protein
VALAIAVAREPRAEGSRREGIGLARIGCKSLCRGDQLCLGYIELMGELHLQMRLNLTKKSRHVTGGGFRRGFIEQTMDKLLRVQLLAMRRIHGCQYERGTHDDHYQYIQRRSRFTANVGVLHTLSMA